MLDSAVNKINFNLINVNSPSKISIFSFSKAVLTIQNNKYIFIMHNVYGKTTKKIITLNV